MVLNFFLHLKSSRAENTNLSDSFDLSTLLLDLCLQGEFVDDGTETHFTLGDHNCCVKAVSSGKRRDGIIHTLLVDGTEIAECTEWLRMWKRRSGLYVWLLVSVKSRGISYKAVGSQGPTHIHSYVWMATLGRVYYPYIGTANVVV